jgi:hypothetical protein
MSGTVRIALKLALMALFVGVLVLFGHVEHEFVYRAF